MWHFEDWSNEALITEINYIWTDIDIENSCFKSLKYFTIYTKSFPVLLCRIHRLLHKNKGWTLLQVDFNAELFSQRKLCFLPHRMWMSKAAYVLPKPEDSLLRPSDISVWTELIFFSEPTGLVLIRSSVHFDPLHRKQNFISNVILFLK